MRSVFRTLLFFPGHRRDMLVRAAASGADALCLDLEDAVPDALKEEARAHALEVLAAPPEGAPPLFIRVNSPGSDVGEADLDALAGALAAGGGPPAIAGIVLPKIRSGGEIRGVDHAVEGDLPLVPLIETVDGLERATEIARASSRVTMLLVGGVDLSAELGCALEWESLLYARSRIIHAVALAGITALDMPFPALKDEAGLEEEARRAGRMGFVGKIAIHPAQVPVIHRALTPPEAEVEQARRVVAAWEEAGGGVTRLDDRMVEAPVVKRALRILALAAGRMEGGATGRER
jgi:citrate lyase beta subunit